VGIAQLSWARTTELIWNLSLPVSGSLSGMAITYGVIEHLHRYGVAGESWSGAIVLQRHAMIQCLSGCPEESNRAWAS